MAFLGDSRPRSCLSCRVDCSISFHSSIPLHLSAFGFDPDIHMPEAPAASSSTTPDVVVGHSSSPQPGDIALLAKPQHRPGDGAFPANGDTSRGRGNHFRNGFRGQSHGIRGRNHVNGRPRLKLNGGLDGDDIGDQSSGTPNTPLQPSSNGVEDKAEHVGTVLSDPIPPYTKQAPPHRPSQPRELVETSVSDANGNRQVESTANGERYKGGKTARQRKTQKRSDGHLSGDKKQDSEPVDGKPNTSKLDASANTFIPTPVPTTPPSHHHAFPSRPTSPHQQSRSDNDRPSKPRPKKGVGGDGRKTTPASPAAPISSRRAAFEQQTKLTTSVSRSSDGSGPRRASPVEAETRLPTNKKGKAEEKDDHVSRLIRGLKSRPFLECPIVCLYVSYEDSTNVRCSVSMPSRHRSIFGPVFRPVTRPQGHRFQ